LYFAATVGGEDPNNQCLVVHSTNQPAPLTLGDFTGDPLFGEKTSDTGSTNQSLCFGVNAIELPPGTYYNDIDVTVDGVANNPVTITLCLTVSEPAVSDSTFITPDTLWFAAVQGGAPPAFECAELTSTNAPAHFVVAGISGSPVFTTANADSGTTPNNVCFTVDQSGLEPGAHYNTVSLEVDGVDNNPVDLVICLLVEAAPVSDSAYISPDTAFFTIVQNSGDSDTGCVAVLSTNAPASYTIGVVDFLPGHRADTAHIFVSLLAAGGMTNDTVCYTVSAGGRAPGVYYNTLSAEVDGVDNNPVSSVVCLTVLEEPPVDPSILAISDTLFSYSADSGSAGLIHDTVFVINAGLGPDFGWTVENQYCLMINSLGDTTYDSSGAIPAEISLDQLNGVTPGFAAFTVDASALNPGYYLCAFWVVADSGVQNSPRRFDVELTVNAPIVDTTLTVFFDIKPGSCPNPINTRGEDR
ncbi:MAG TPA: hypothetical protein VLB27_03770, partial [candidate division Zixibacteria bacterium]|nr:hypothetical protein [candidate division Zixibacteria bacterium]